MDLQLPLTSSDKKLIAVVATVSLGNVLTRYKKHYPQFDTISGVGVDIRVANSVCFGLSSSMEDLIQEGGRAMRGGSHETGGKL